MGIFRAENILSVFHPKKKCQVISYYVSRGFRFSLPMVMPGFFPYIKLPPTLHISITFTIQCRKARHVVPMRNKGAPPPPKKKLYNSSQRLRESQLLSRAAIPAVWTLSFPLSFPKYFNLFFKISVVFFTSGNNFCLLKVSLEKARRLQVF